MTEELMNRDISIGKHLAALRENAKLKQNELAKRLEWSPAVLSRVETGERPLGDGELSIILEGIGTPEAARLKGILERQWRVLPEPTLGDPDSDFLWEAEQAAQAIHALAEQPDVKQVFERRLVRYEEELSVAAQRVMNKRYRAAFIGTIAVGKSTAICRAEGLELPGAKGMPKAVLETGAGGITICEVHLRKGPGYGLIIEPCTEDEIRRHVMDFASFLLNPAHPQAGDDDEEGAGSPGISREVERALRNMTKLRRKRAERKPNGTVIPAVDDARVLAATMPDAKALAVELLARMELHRRDRRDLWHSSEEGIPPLEWLQSLFEKVNNGRHDEFTLPKRIELVIPTAVLGDDSIAVTLIDTQGIDDIAARADLEQHFDDTHTVVVLCTVFNEAPATPVRQLLTRAKEGGVRTLASHAAILALPRPGEALAMKDNGYPAQSAEEGYELKGEEVKLKLHPLGLTDLPLAFFNAAEDEPESLRSFVRTRIAAVQEFHRATLREIITGANSLLANYEKEQAREAMRAAAHRLTTWLDNHAALSSSQPVHRVHESLIAATGQAHWKTVYASIARRGEWPNLNYAHQLSHGARRIAAQVIEPKLVAFKTIAGNVMDDGELSEAHDLVRQTVRVLDDSFDGIVRTAQLVGESVHSDELSEDFDFWRHCSTISGSGYRDRINGQNRQWFEDAHAGQAETRVMEVVGQKWNDAITTVRNLLSQE
jgi:transcriptional regulator with XRE-family HTH domain